MTDEPGAPGDESRARSPNLAGSVDRTDESGGGRVEVQLLLHDDGNRRALATVVGEHFTPVTDQEVREADCYLVDDAAFPSYRDALEARKREDSPVFCPVVLIKRDLTAVTVDLPDPFESEHPHLVDAVLSAPVEAPALDRTLANLLAQRRQTRDLRDQNARLERFASVLRHELRNPLTVIDGNLDLARRTGEDRHLDQCRDAVERIETLLEVALFLLEGDEASIDPGPVDLAVVANECAEMLAGADVEVRIDASTRIAADEGHLRHLVENLFRNAAEHGGGNVTIVVGDLDGGFFVEDDGAGIRDAIQSRVLEEGFTTEASGSGLGLAVVQAVADAHGWELTLTEGRGGGARFEFRGVEVDPMPGPAD